MVQPESVIVQPPLTVSPLYMPERNTILVIEDDDFLRPALVDIVELAGHAATAVATGCDALRRAQAESFDLALLDVRLPDCLGSDLLGAFRDLAPDTQIIVITGYASAESAVAALNEGAVAYLSKPVDTDELLATIRQALARRHLVLENRRLHEDYRRELAERQRAEDVIRQERDLAVALTAAVSLREGLELCVNAALQISHMDAGAVYLVLPDGSVGIKLHRGFSDGFIKAVYNYPQASPQARVVHAGLPFYMDAASGGLGIGELLTGEGLKGIAILPVSHDGRVIACMNLASKHFADVPAATRHVLETIAAQAGGAIVRLQTMDALRESEERYRELAELLPQTVFEMDTKGKLTFVNRSALDMFGYSAQDFEAGVSVLNVVAPHDLERAGENIRRRIAGEELGTNEYTAMRKNGDTFPVRVFSVPVVHSGKTVGVRGLMVDMTEEKRIQAELAHHQGELRALASELSLTEERERRRLATDLHDHVGQTLAVAKMRLGALRRALSTEEGRQAHTEVLDLFADAVQRVRTLSFELSPPILYDLGLEAAVEWLGSHFEQQHGIRCEFSSDGDIAGLDETGSILMFRSTQELLTNAAKHAGADRLTLSVRSRRHELEIMVADDGAGFDVSALQRDAAETHSFGLFSIRERMRHIGGRVDIASQPGKGTTVRLVCPLDAGQGRSGQ